MRGSSTGLTLNVKVSLFGAVIVLIVVAALVSLAVWQSGRYNDLAQSEVDGLIDADLDHITLGIYNLVQTENEAVQQQVDADLNLAQHLLAGAGGVSLATESVAWAAVNQLTDERTAIRLPKMLLGGLWLGNNPDPAVETPVVDEVTRLIGDSATVFQRMNPRGDMLRVATTVKTVEGRRAVGTYVPAINRDGTANSVIDSVMRGKTYSGRAYVVNAYYLTAYHAIRDAGGAVVGMLYVGVKLANVEARVRQAILRTPVGRTGYVYVLGGTGEGRGRYIISQRGERDGEEIWGDTDSDGRLVIQDIVKKAVTLKPGELATEHYRWQNLGESAPRWKVVRLAYFEPWDWVIGTSAYEDELRGYRTILIEGRQRMTAFMGAAGFAITALMALLGAFLAWTIVGPVRRLTAAAETIIGGNLDGTVDVRSRDEIGVLARTFNIMTERLKRTMEGLRRSEEKYRGIFENAIEGFFQSSLEGRFLTVNPAMAGVLGYDSPADLVERVTDIGPQLYVRPEDRDEIIAALLEEWPVVRREVQFRRKDGGAIWVSLNDHLVRDGNGKPSHIEGFIYDITERIRGESELALERSLLKALMENIPDHIYFKDAESRFIRTSRAHARMFGLRDATEAIGKTDMDFFSGEHAQKAYEDEQRIIRTGEPILNVEEKETWPNRHDTWALTTKMPLRDQEGNIIGTFGISRDITERKRAEMENARLNRALRMLSDSNQTLIHVTDETALLKEVCRIVVDVGGYRMAWVGFAEHDETKTLRPIAQAGCDAGYIKSANVTWADNERGRGPGGTAIRTGQPCIARNIPLDPGFAPWREAAIQRGYKSLIALPLICEGRTLGALGIYSGEIDVFDTREVEILKELAGDLAFGITALRTRAERNQAEVALQQNEERYRLIAENTADTITVSDLALKPIFVSPSVQRLSGYAVQEVMELSLDQLLTPESLQKVHTAITEQMELEAGGKGDPSRTALLELEVYCKDGSTIWVELAASFLRDNNLKPTGILTVTRDITKRKQAEAARQLLASAIEQAAEMIVITDAAATIEYVNPAFEAITGYSREEAIGRNPRILKSGAQDAAFYEGLWQTISNGKTWTGRFVNKKKDGTRYAENATISPVHDSAGTIVKYVAVKHDVTRERQLEDQLRQMQKMESMGRLTGGVAHDFNNILQVITGYCGLLSVGLSDENQQYLAEITKAAKGAAALTAQLLAFSRKQILSPRVVNTKDLIRSMHKMLERIIGEDIELRTLMDPNTGSFLADPGQMGQVLLNLAVNARDAMPLGGELTLETSNRAFDEAYVHDHPGAKAGQYVCIALSDTGVGMDQETLSHIYEPFFTTKESGKGTGLGLPTVFGIVRQSEGYINCYSEKGRGTTFTIYLPLTSEQADKPLVEVSGTTAPRGTETILLVDDDKAVRSVARIALKEAGYVVIEAPGGEEALSDVMARNITVELLVTDVVMPRMSGKELAQKLEGTCPGVRVLYASGYTANVISHHGILEAGIDFLQKPFSSAGLLTKVREILDRP